jgi:type I restriction enzyme S subunit
VAIEATAHPAEGRRRKDDLASIKPCIDESLPEPPEEWAWVKIQDIAQLIRNGYSGKPTEKGSVPILRISSVRAMSVDPSDTRRLEGEMQDYGKSIASKGCLLITRYNGNPDLVGVMGLLRSPDPVVHPDKLIRVEIDLPCINNEWVEIAFNTGITRHLLRQRVRTTAGQAGISGLDVKQMPIPVPPIREQQRIVAKVQRRFSVLDQVEATVNACLSRCGQFKQVALKRVFEG